MLVSTYWISHPLKCLSVLRSNKCNEFRMLYFYPVCLWWYAALILTSLFAHPDSDVYLIPFTLQSLCSLLLFVVLIAQRGSIKTCINLNSIAGALSCLEAVHCVTWPLRLIHRGLIDFAQEQLDSDTGTSSSISNSWTNSLWAQTIRLHNILARGTDEAKAACTFCNTPTSFPFPLLANLKHLIWCL